VSGYRKDGRLSEMAEHVEPGASPGRRQGSPPLRAYQRDAVDAAVSMLGNGGRAQLVAACGTGKTLIAVHVAARLAPNGLVVVAAPSLPLIAQTLSVWAAAGVVGRMLAVCSDHGVADTAVRVADLPCPVTTNPEDIVEWLRARPVGGMRLVLTTYQSAHVTGAALVKADLAADLLILDEAHHTAGRRDKTYALVHDDSRLPATRRLYMTATRRLLARTRHGRSADIDTVMSMDDPATFGPVCYHYPFAQAIEDDVLDDFRVVVVGVTRHDVLQLLRTMDPHAVVEDTNASLRTIVHHAALAQATCEFGLRRVLVFCPRIDDSKLFARTLPATLNALPAHQRPAGHLTAIHIDGTHTVSERQQQLAKLAHPPKGGWTVISNARCLGEGIDVPAVDAVMFTRPKTEIDLVQAIGRALRRNRDGTGVAELFRRYADDGATIADLARWMAEQGVPTRTGKTQWDRSVIWGMLRNPAYAGQAVFGKTMAVHESPGLNRRARLEGRDTPRAVKTGEVPPLSRRLLIMV